MAPRRKPRKRLSRMDAATDAMIAFGFDQRLVQKTVKQLLKEYGGYDGWAFIEEYGYKELIEAILRDQESNNEDTTKKKQGVSSQDERAEDSALQSILGPSGTLVDSTCNKAGITAGETSCSELVNAVEPKHMELCSNEVFCPPPAERDTSSWKDIAVDQISTQKELANVVFHDGGNSGNQVQPAHVFSPPPTSSPCPVNYLKVCSASQEKSGSNSHVSTPPPPADHHPTTPPSSTAVCLQSALGETACSMLVDAVGEPKDEELCSNKQDIGTTGVVCLPPAEGDGRRCKDVLEDQTSTQKETANVGGNSVLQAVSNSHVTTTLLPTSPCPVNNHCPTTRPSSKRACLERPPRRFPCYGWIESDDEENPDDFIELAPMKCIEFSK